MKDKSRNNFFVGLALALLVLTPAIALFDTQYYPLITYSVNLSDFANKSADNVFTGNNNHTGIEWFTGDVYINNITITNLSQNVTGDWYVYGNTYLNKNFNGQLAMYITNPSTGSASSSAIYVQAGAVEGSLTASKLTNNFTILAGSSDSLQLGANNVPRMTISSTSGYVGINDTTPSYTLDVSGSAMIQNALYVSSTTYYWIPATLRNGNLLFNGGNPSLLYSGTNIPFQIYAQGTGDISLGVNAGKTIFIEADNNNVGIGTTTPTNTLTVNGTLRVIAIATPTCSSTTAGAIYYNATDFKHYGCNSTTWNALY